MSEDPVQRHVDLIREVFLYAERFKNKRFVIQISSDLVEDQWFPALVQDLGILHRAGIQVILVPGAARRIDKVLATYGVPTQSVGTTRVSTDEAMPLIKMAAFDVANEVLTHLASQQIDALIGNWVRARAIGVRDGVDFHNAGMVTGIHSDTLKQVLAEGHLPIFPCVGWSATGKPYNISSVELATNIAESLKAEKLFFLDDDLEFEAAGHELPQDGTLIADGRLARMTVKSAVFFAERNDNLTQLEYDVLRFGSHAATNGVQRVHYLNGSIDGAILREVFSALGQGTMIYTDEFEAIRPMRSEDVPEVLRVMEPSIAKGILVPRDEEYMLRMYEHFVVYESDESVRGCCALVPYGTIQAEIAGLAVDESFGHYGIGQKLVTFLIDEAKKRRLTQVFLLTTQTADYFESLGFKRGELKDLPAERQKTYDPSRKSRIYGLSL